MTHPITPPRELVEQWASEKCYDERDWLYELHIANRAAQWGADQELEACCKLAPGIANYFRERRRPKPPSLKEQALALLDPSNTYGSITRGEEYRISIANAETIRRALEALPE